MARLTTIELFKENFKFSCAHFTIFSKEKRENIHGHTFHVKVILESEVGDNGMTFDYTIYKREIVALCKSLNEHFLLPERSPYLSLNEDEDYVYISFHNEKIPFLKRDVKKLPIINTTVEELSYWFLSQLKKDKGKLENFGIRKINVQVFSGPGQCGSTCWEKT